MMAPTVRPSVWTWAGSWNLSSSLGRGLATSAGASTTALSFSWEASTLTGLWLDNIQLKTKILRKTPNVLHQFDVDHLEKFSLLESF